MPPTAISSINLVFPTCKQPKEVPHEFYPTIAFPYVSALPIASCRRPGTPSSLIDGGAGGGRRRGIIKNLLVRMK